MTETTEHEAIKAFNDGVREAASCILKLETPEKYPFAPLQFVKAIDRASGSAYQLGHMQTNPDFFRIRDMLDLLKKQVALMAIGSKMGRTPIPVDGGNPFKKIADMVLGIAERGMTIAMSKAVTKQGVNEALDLRELFLKQVEGNA